MKPQVQLYEDPAERRRKQREKSQKFYTAFNRAFGERLCQATAEFQAKTGRTFTHPELAAMLRERVGKPITPRYVGRWYRGLASPVDYSRECMVELGKIFDVTVCWLSYGEGERKQKTRGVSRSGDHLLLRGSRGEMLVDVWLMPELVADDDVLTKCWELLDIISSDQPSLRVVK